MLQSSTTHARDRITSARRHYSTAMRLLLISSSVVHNFGYLDHPEPEIRRLLAGLERVAFIPFAAHDHAAYTAKVRERFGRMGFDVVERIEDGEAIFVGGGNTFR